MFRFISIAIAASFLLVQNSYAAEVNIDRNTEVSADVVKKDVPTVIKKKAIEKKVIKKEEKMKAIKKEAKHIKKEPKIMKKEIKKDDVAKVIK